MKMENIYITIHISYKYPTCQIFMDTCNEKYQNTISTCEEDKKHDT